MKGKNLKALIGAMAVAVLVTANTYPGLAVSRVKTPSPDMVTATPAGNIFKIDGDPTGKEFVLLDTTENDQSKFFIISKNHYGLHVYSEASAANMQAFDVNEPKNIAHWLNNSFKTGGNGGSYVLPSQIASHIDNSHVWTTEGANGRTSVPNEYTTTCGLALMSQTEWSAYQGKFGVYDDVPYAQNGWNAWWLRTVRSDVYDNYSDMIISPVNAFNTPGTTSTALATNTSSYVRPVFYLDRTFFATVKLDIFSLGENVKKAIRDTYTFQEMQETGLYSLSELASIGYALPWGQNITADNYPFSIDRYSLTSKDSGAEPVLQAGGSLRLTASISNHTSQDKQATMIVALFDGNRLIKAGLDKKAVGAGASAEFSSAYEIIQNMAEPKVRAYVWDGFSNMVPLTGIEPLENDAGYLGICESMYRYSDYLQECDQMIAAGVKWVRVGITWGSLMPGKGVINTAALQKYDEIVDKMTANGIRIIFPLGYTAPWASINPGSSTPERFRPSDAHWADWEEYVTFVTNRYKGKISHWEVWNEPDYVTSAGTINLSTEDYYILLQKAFVKIKQTDPNNKVLMGGLACQDGSRGIGSWFDSLMALGAGSYFDLLNYHAYGDGSRLGKIYDDMMAVVDKYSSSLGSKDIWITETGYTTAGDSTKEPYKADYMDQTYQFHKRLTKVKRIILYNYRNLYDPDNTNASEASFGLVKNDLTPNQAFYHFQGLTGASADFALQKKYPELVRNLALLHYEADASGSNVTDDGPNKRIRAGTCLYLKINDNWLTDTNQGLDTTVYVDVTYKDEGISTWKLEYDGAPGIYTSTENVQKTNTNQFTTKTFTLDDARFANRQYNNADFRICAGEEDLTLYKIVVRKQSNQGKVILNSTNLFKMIRHQIGTVTTEEAWNPVAVVGGIECRSITANNRYFYMRVGEGLVREGDHNVTITLKYWGEKANDSDKLQLQYYGTDDLLKTVNIPKSGRQQWDIYTIRLNDARFNNPFYYYADFRIGNGGDGSAEYVSAVEVIRQ